MKILDHRLCEDDGTPVLQQPSPNHGGPFEPSFLLMHYTAGRTAASAASWLCNPKAAAAAHLIIGKDGACIQLVPFNLVAWHAGVSSWVERGAGKRADGSVYDVVLQGMNKYSLGIELDNPGRLVRVAPGGNWRSLALGTSYPAEDGIELTHKNEHKPSGWHLYPEAQLDKAFEVAHLLAEHYSLRDVMGHDDVAPGRKTDPGPAFDMEHFRSRLTGRGSDDSETLKIAQFERQVLTG
jgi:N-acetylmuramoyl-L-alanine amidase